MHIHTFNHTDYGYHDVNSHMPTLYVKVHGAEGLQPWAFVKKISELNIKSSLGGEMAELSPSQKSLLSRSYFGLRLDSKPEQKQQLPVTFQWKSC